jgi:hypothetical protein
MQCCSCEVVHAIADETQNFYDVTVLADVMHQTISLHVSPLTSTLTRTEMKSGTPNCW